MKLPFTSPFINISVPKDDFSKLIVDPLFYINTELKLVRNGSLEDEIFPIASLGDANRNIKLDLVHDASFAEGKENWNRRLRRVNTHNIFIKMGFRKADTNSEEWIEAFESVEYKKVLFCYGLENVENAFESKRYLWVRYGNYKRVDNYAFWNYERNEYMRDLDILKLLNGESDYSRY